MKKYFFIYVVISLYLSTKPCLGMQQEINGRFGIGPRVFTRKDQLQIQELLLHTQLDRGSFTLLESAVAYGFTKTLGLEVFLPWFFQQKLDGKKSSGLGDVIVEAQWHFYPQIENVGIATFGIRFPTGSTSKEPALGIGTYGYIFEVAGIHSSECWYASTVYRTRINQRRKDKKLGIRFLYSVSFGPKLHLKNGAKVLTILRLDGIYDAIDKKNGTTIPNTGGNVILSGPLISWKKENIIIEGSIQLPISQRTHGNQPKIEWLSIFNIEVTF